MATTKDVEERLEELAANIDPTKGRNMAERHIMEACKSYIEARLNMLRSGYLVSRRAEREA